MLDLDGTVYQTLDLKECAEHATIANGRSVGIEVANIGAYPLATADPLKLWYQRDSAGRIRIVDPDAKQEGRHDPATLLRPIREEPISGTIQGQAASPVRLHGRAVRGTRAAVGNAVHALPQDSVRLSARRRRRPHPAKARRFGAGSLSGNTGPLSRADQQGRPGTSFPMGQVDR